MPSASSSSASASASAPSPARPRPKVRLGFWNQRGDHLVEVDVHPSTSTSSPASGSSSHSSSSMRNKAYYVVYAPPGHTYPEELHNYPAPEHAWRDHRGLQMQHDPKFEEWPDSLPRRGRAPRAPYESVSGACA